MRYRVIEAFSTPLRRFVVGMKIVGEDVADGLLTVEHWLGLGKIAPVESMKPAVKSAPEPDPEPAKVPEPTAKPAT